MNFQPMLACDYDPAKAVWPMVALPKTDGVRGTHGGDGFIARSGEPHANLYTTYLYSHHALVGVDGELVAESITHPALCRLTTSAVSTIEGEPFTQLWAFDWLNEQTRDMGYLDRLQYTHARVAALHHQYPGMRNHLRAMPYVVVNNQAELDAVCAKYEAEGYEGTIVRRIDGKYKHGRATAKEMTYGRVKSWQHAEIRVTKLLEGEANENELEADYYGKAKRSTHQENMVPNGMVGAFLGELMEDVYVNNGAKRFTKGTIVKVAAGKIPHDQRKLWFECPELVVGQALKFKHFPHGVKDALRFPTAQTLRPPQDLV
jgi:DNA ligase-1